MPNESTPHTEKVGDPCADITRLDITPAQLRHALTKAFDNLPSEMEVASEAKEMIVHRAMLNAAMV